MNKLRLSALAFFGSLVLAACSTVPDANPMLDAAHSDYRAAQDNPRVRDLAGLELKEAGDAINVADASWSRRDSTTEVNHWAYVARQRVAIAQETASQKSAEAAVVNANSSRDKIRLAARTNEADAAQRSALNAQQQAEESQRQSEAARRDADVAQRDANTAQRDAQAAQRDAQMAQQQTADAQARNAQLEALMKDLNAKKTDRGMVITIGDVLFDTNKSELKSGGLRSVEKLGGFLKQYPQRKALIEGFTDSVGTQSANQELSDRRASAVRLALVGAGVAGDRVTTRGYGEAYPVAGNDSGSGRQLNRRVEIIVSDDNGTIAPR
ncbi:MAG: OmpA family protein [Rhizobacter sp.]